MKIKIKFIYAALIISIIGMLIVRVIMHRVQEVQSESVVIDTNVSRLIPVGHPGKPSTLVADSKDPNLLTYTSYRLGVQFSFLKDGGYPGENYTVFERGNKISFRQGASDEYDDMDGDIIIFDKNKTETVEQALRRQIPEQFKNKYCSVVNLTKYEYLIWDKRIIPVAEYFRLTTLDGSPYQNLKDVVCLPVLAYTVDPVFPDIIYYLYHPTQAVSFFANEAHTKEWWQTFHLIKKE